MRNNLYYKTYTGLQEGFGKGKANMRNKSLDKLLIVYFGGILLSVFILSAVVTLCLYEISAVNKEVRSENTYASHLYEAEIATINGVRI